MSTPPIRIELRGSEDVVLARRRSRQLAAELGLDAHQQVRLATAVSEVARNAVQYAGGGWAELGLDTAGEACLVVRVVDRGPGVPDEAKERIFEPFQRYGDAPRGAGVGLGLAVARGFAEAMGGTLDAEDTPGGGLTMVLTLRAGGSGAEELLLPAHVRPVRPERQVS